MEYRKREVAETEAIGRMELARQMETIGRMELARKMESVGRTELAGNTKRNKRIERKNTEPMKQCGKYSTILSHPYPFPLCRQRVDLSHRAVQFFSFAALKGYEEMIEE